VRRRICPVPSRACSPMTEPVSSRAPILFPGRAASSPSTCQRRMFRSFSHVVVDRPQNQRMDAPSCRPRLSIVPRAPVSLPDRTCSPSRVHTRTLCLSQSARRRYLDVHTRPTHAACTGRPPFNTRWSIEQPDLFVSHSSLSLICNCRPPCHVPRICFCSCSSLSPPHTLLLPFIPSAHTAHALPPYSSSTSRQRALLAGAECH
jgi:hypothetical protein